MKLSDLKVGEKAKIVSIHGKGITKRRLMDMGIVSGEILIVEKVAPLGDPVDIVVKGYHLSLRKLETEEIEVEVLS
ncbi:MAG: ferrous iron transport protein A [Deltaproteobacteria bacterium]|nr:ferrous iron transport protein A [Deltaproteobacteria bacterium]